MRRIILLATAVGFVAVSFVLSASPSRANPVREVQVVAKQFAFGCLRFAGAVALTLAVAIAAVLVHTWGMAGVRPVTALRYE